MLTGVAYYKEGDVVTVKIDEKQQGVGCLRGLAHEFPIVNMWIVEMLNWGTIKHEEYKWSCLILPSSYLTFVAELKCDEIR